MRRSIVERLLRNEVSIEDVVLNPHFIHALPKELYSKLMENYDDYREGRISEGMMLTQLLLCLMKNSKDFDKIVALSIQLKQLSIKNN